MDVSHVRANRLLEEEIPQTTLKDATAVTAVPGRVGAFSAAIPPDWTIISVPHGGFVAALLASAVKAFFTTDPTFGPRNQPDSINYHIEFLARCFVAPATLVVTPIKAGRAVSIVRVELFQTPPGSDKEVLCTLGVVTQGNINAEIGITHASPPLIAPDDFPQRLKDCRPLQWDVRRPQATKKMILWDPKYVDPKTKQTGVGRKGWNIREQWMSFADGTPFDETALPLLADMFVPIPENIFVLTEDAHKHWYPTCNLDLEIKQKGSWKWLFVRSRVHVLKNGRYDIEVAIMDENAEVVALSKHVSMVVDISRNLSGRTSVPASSKI